MNTFANPDVRGPANTARTPAKAARIALLVTLSALALGGCRHLEDPGTRVAGWALVDPAQRHPILVSQEPTELTIHVPRGSSGLSPAQRSRLLDFYGHFRATDAGNSRLVIQAPSGSENEVAAMHTVQDIRQLLGSEGIADSDMVVEAYNPGPDRAAPVRISYLRYVAHAPECGDFSTNLAFEPGNLPYPNLGCATQRNFAAQVANPADLLGPRTMTARSSERRDQQWNQYLKGDTTTAKKSEEEKVKVKDSN